MNQPPQPSLYKTIIHNLGSRGWARPKLIDSSRDNLVLVDKKHDRIARVSLTKSVDDVTEEIRLIKFLVAKNYPAPPVLDSFVLDFGSDQYPVTLFEYIDHMVFDNLSANMITQSAVALRRFHLLTYEYSKTHSFKQKRELGDSIEKFIHSIESDHPTANNTDTVYDDMLWGKKFLKDASAHASSLLPMILHNDYRKQNILFTPDKNLKAVIDFDWSLTSKFPEKDIAHSALEFSMADGDPKPDMDKFRTFVSSYYEDRVKVDYPDIYNWVKSSALYDASHYFLSYPERTSVTFNSFMYDKYLFFKNSA